MNEYQTKPKDETLNGKTNAAPCSSHCSTTIDCDINSTLAELHVAEQAIREEPYDRLPALAGMLAIASMRIEKLKAIVDALPRTADGVPIVPGMNLYTCYWKEVQDDVVDGFSVHLKQPTIWKDGEADEGWLFADRDKAEAARAKRHNNH